MRREKNDSPGMGQKEVTRRFWRSYTLHTAARVLAKLKKRKEFGNVMALAEKTKNVIFCSYKLSLLILQEEENICVSRLGEHKPYGIERFFVCLQSWW